MSRKLDWRSVRNKISAFFKVAPDEKTGDLYAIAFRIVISPVRVTPNSDPSDAWREDGGWR